MLPIKFTRSTFDSTDAAVGPVNAAAIASAEITAADTACLDPHDPVAIGGFVRVGASPTPWMLGKLAASLRKKVALPIPRDEPLISYPR